MAVSNRSLTTFSGVSGSWRWLAMIIVVLTASPTVVSAQHTANTDEVTIERTVREISRLRRVGNANELYDWLAPDARFRISRESFVAWALDDDTFQPQRDPEIDDIEIGDYTWPVTGTPLPNIAVVTVHQRGELDGVAIYQEIVYPLQYDGSRWRWLFGGGEVNLLDAASMDPLPLDYTSPYDDAPYHDIDLFWARVFADAGRDYQTMSAVVPVVEQPLNTPCGVVTQIDQLGIYVCLVNTTIYYSPKLKDHIDSTHGPMGWHTIVGHEWTHMVQAQLGIAYVTDPEVRDGAYILELELQADCMTGIYMQAERGAGLITASDYRAAVDVLNTYGDRTEPLFDSTVAHGTGAKRVASFENGADNGFVGCGLDLDDW